MCDAAAARDFPARLLRLDALQAELAQRGFRTQVRAETPIRWALIVRSPSWKLRALRVYCIGAEGAFAFVTRHGRILACADDDGVRLAADILAPPRRS